MGLRPLRLPLVLELRNEQILVTIGYPDDHVVLHLLNRHEFESTTHANINCAQKEETSTDSKDESADEPEAAEEPEEEEEEEEEDEDEPVDPKEKLEEGA
jgi:hypothetical protein